MQMSMSPSEVNTQLPPLTKSKYITHPQAEELIKTGKCKYLVRNRTYVAPMGISIKEDLKNGAIGIDEWVKIDGGNAYELKSSNWHPVGNNGATQLHLEFDTMLCE
jgi:hypothetical protein